MVSEQAAMWWGGGLCDYCVSPSPFGLDFGTSDLGLTTRRSILRELTET